MHMLDWNKYRQQLVAGVGGFASSTPISSGLHHMSRAARRHGHSMKDPRTHRVRRHHPALRRLHHGAYRGGRERGSTGRSRTKCWGRGGLVNEPRPSSIHPARARSTPPPKHPNAEENS